MPFPILRNSTTGEYLFENHTISFTPVLQVLVHCDQRDISLQESSLKVVPSMALGDPEYPLSGDKLLGTLNEINDICDLFSEVEVGYVETLHGVEATAKNLLSRAEFPVDEVRGFIHLAAYNHVNKDHKSGSLHLAYPKLVKRDRASKRMAAEKAYLWSEKIMQCGFEWRSHMVVLSACDSAKGYVSNIYIHFIS
jgi:CHAT domain-containing protein